MVNRVFAAWSSDDHAGIMPLKRRLSIPTLHGHLIGLKAGQIRRIQQLVGISHFNCSFWFGDLEQARVLRSMELFAREVMPAFA